MFKTIPENYTQASRMFDLGLLKSSVRHIISGWVGDGVQEAHSGVTFLKLAYRTYKEELSSRTHKIMNPKPLNIKPIQTSQTYVNLQTPL